jgi:WD40 repeat protein
LKEINEFTQDYIDGVKAIQENCQKEHIISPPVAHYCLDLYNAEGEHELEYKLPSKSWVRNGYNTVVTALTGLPTNTGSGKYEAGSLALGDKIGALIADATQTNVSINGLTSASGSILSGVVVGASNVAEDFGYRALINPIPDGATRKLVKKVIPYNNFNSTGSRACAYSPDGAHVVVGFNSSPYLQIFRNAPETYEKLADPDVMPTGAVYAIKYSSDGNYLLVAHDTTPFFTLYSRNGDTYTKLPNPVDLPNGNGRGIGISSDGVYFAVTSDAYDAPCSYFYKRTDTTIAKIFDNKGYGYFGNVAAMSDDGVYYMAADNKPDNVTLLAYKRTGDTWAVIAKPAEYITAAIADIAFSSGGLYLAIGGGGTNPGFYCYKRTGDTFNRISVTNVVDNGTTGLSFTPDGKYLAVAGSAYKYLSMYENIDDNYTFLGGTDILPTTYPENCDIASDGSEVICCFGNQYAEGALLRYSFVHGLSYGSQTEPTVSYNADTKKLTISFQRTFTNNSTTDTVTVKEVAVYSLWSGSKTVMLNREVLATPVDIAPSAALSITFNIEIIYPE